MLIFPIVLIVGFGLIVAIVKLLRQHERAQAHYAIDPLYEKKFHEYYGNLDRQENTKRDALSTFPRLLLL